ncbi:hypothetical protein ACIQVR_37505 [Streptomyces xanthochromogenes]|uniref:hypothetical protein n=1 Tax=Streptomyces xanthochromogenes TaxID=67384 RepID=UPI0037FC1147
MLQYNDLLYLAPCEVQQIQCVSLASSTGERCKRKVYTDVEGEWKQVDIPPAPGRSGQDTLMTGQMMWVYDMSILDPYSFRRWKVQNCQTHHETAAPDAEMTELVAFQTWRHSEFITYEEPGMAKEERKRRVHALKSLLPALPKTRCAGCSQYSHEKQKEGWLCAKCEATAVRRERTHRKWQSPPPQTLPAAEETAF